jgi:hypothetical protein
VKGVLLFAVAAVFLVSGCGGGKTTHVDVEKEPFPGKSTTLRVYFLRSEKVWPAALVVAAKDATPQAALVALVSGPRAMGVSRIGLTTALTTDEVPAISVRDGVAHVGGEAETSREALAQLVYTLTQFPTVTKVEIGGRRYTRADFEDQTPAILVESPLPFEDVSSPIRATGTANTFEATFNYELTDSDGRIVDENFVTATSGTGTRGTFDFTTKKFTVPFDGVGSLIVFERSAENGSRTKLVEIPLRMSQ